MCKINRCATVNTILCNSLYDSPEKLIVVDYVKKMEGKEISLKYRTRDRQTKKYLKINQARIKKLS